MGNITILKPKINTVNISPNPVHQNKQFKISIDVIEELVTIEQVRLYCGFYIIGQELGGVR